MYHVLLPVAGDEARAAGQAEVVAGLAGAGATLRASVLHGWTGRIEDAPSETVGSQSPSRNPAVREALDRLEDADVETELIDGAGDPQDLILQTAEELDPDLIVMGGRKRSPAGKAIFGSVTQSVILNTERPVTVVGASPQSD
jgi:nucleotide-binding universal stress UspA family protein